MALGRTRVGRHALTIHGHRTDTCRNGCTRGNAHTVATIVLRVRAAASFIPANSADSVTRSSVGLKEATVRIDTDDYICATGRRVKENHALTIRIAIRVEVHIQGACTSCLDIQRCRTIANHHVPISP